MINDFEAISDATGGGQPGKEGIYYLFFMEMGGFRLGG